MLIINVDIIYFVRLNIFGWAVLICLAPQLLLVCMVDGFTNNNQKILCGESEFCCFIFYCNYYLSLSLSRPNRLYHIYRGINHFGFRFSIILFWCCCCARRRSHHRRRRGRRNCYFHQFISAFSGTIVGKNRNESCWNTAYSPIERVANICNITTHKTKQEKNNNSILCTASAERNHGTDSHCVLNDFLAAFPLLVGNLFLHCYRTCASVAA